MAIFSAAKIKCFDEIKNGWYFLFGLTFFILNLLLFLH